MHKKVVDTIYNNKAPLNKRSLSAKVPTRFCALVTIYARARVGLHAKIACFVYRQRQLVVSQ